MTSSAEEEDLPSAPHPHPVAISHIAVPFLCVFWHLSEPSFSVNTTLTVRFWSFGVVLLHLLGLIF